MGMEKRSICATSPLLLHVSPHARRLCALQCQFRVISKYKSVTFDHLVIPEVWIQLLAHLQSTCNSLGCSGPKLIEALKQMLNSRDAQVSGLDAGQQRRISLENASWKTKWKCPRFNNLYFNHYSQLQGSPFVPSFHGFLTVQRAEQKPWQLCSNPGLTPGFNTSNLEALSTLAPERVFSRFEASCYKYVNSGAFKTLQIPRFINSKDCRTSIAWCLVLLSPGNVVGQGLCIFGALWLGKLEKGNRRTLPYSADLSCGGWHLALVSPWINKCFHVSFPEIYPFRTSSALRFLEFFLFLSSL